MLNESRDCSHAHSKPACGFRDCEVGCVGHLQQKKPIPKDGQPVPLSCWQPSYPADGGTSSFAPDPLRPFAVFSATLKSAKSNVHDRVFHVKPT